MENYTTHVQNQGGCFKNNNMLIIAVAVLVLFPQILGGPCGMGGLGGLTSLLDNPLILIVLLMLVM